MRIRAVSTLAIAFAGAAACESLTELATRDPVPTEGRAEGGIIEGVPSSDASCAAPLTACQEGCVNTRIDPHHCGACGHDCLRGECNDGVCAPVVVHSGGDAGVKALA